MSGRDKVENALNTCPSTWPIPIPTMADAAISSYLPRRSSDKFYDFSKGEGRTTILMLNLALHNTKYYLLKNSWWGPRVGRGSNLRNWSLITGRRGGGASQVLPLPKGGRSGKSVDSHAEGGTKRCGVVLTQELEVLDKLKGRGRKKTHSIRVL